MPSKAEMESWFFSNARQISSSISAKSNPALKMEAL
jgi:hypothetical protein